MKKSNLKVPAKLTIEQFLENKEEFARIEKKTKAERSELLKKFEELSKHLINESDRLSVPFEDEEGYFMGYNERQGYAHYIPKFFIETVAPALEKLNSEDLKEAIKGIGVLTDGYTGFDMRDGFKAKDFEEFTGNYGDGGWVSSSC